MKISLRYNTFGNNWFGHLLYWILLVPFFTLIALSFLLYGLCIVLLVPPLFIYKVIDEVLNGRFGK